MSAPRPMMLVSADAGPELRSQVATASRPCPDYLRLEARHDVRLLDWSGISGGTGRRSVGLSVRHVRAALLRLDTADVVLSDGEHVGIPLALAMRHRHLATPHLVIGHHLASPSKARLFRWTKAHRRMDRILVHSPNQLELLESALGLSPHQLHLLPYGVDTDFWSPQSFDDEKDLVVSIGREHRDNQLLVDAVGGMCPLFLTDSSTHSPHARRRGAGDYPEAVERRSVTHLELRALYDRAAVVVVPLLPSDYPFGITAVLEGMSMAKAVVVSDTVGLSGVVEDGRTGVVVPPGDVAALRTAVRSLLDDPPARARMGSAAGRAARERFGLDRFVDGIGRHLHELGGCHKVDAVDQVDGSTRVTEGRG